MRIRRLARNSSGQALVETALIMPLMLIFVLNAVNFAFFVLMALNITAASRTSGIYSIMGGATPAAKALPLAGSETTTSSLSYLAYQDLTGAVSTPSTLNTGVHVCSSTIGTSGTGTSTVTSCASATSAGIGGGFPTSAEVDPEAPSFLLARVDVAYKFTPPIPASPFTIFLGLAPNCNAAGTSCTFYRHIVMREMQ